MNTIFTMLKEIRLSITTDKKWSYQMSIHKSNKNARPDSDYLSGEIKFIVKGNECRLLDGRRTPGVIEDYFKESGQFRWRITDFEDAGSYWDVPAENIQSYQVLIGSEELDFQTVQEIEATVKAFDQELHIDVSDEARVTTEREINVVQEAIEKWMRQHSTWMKQGHVLDLDSETGNRLLMDDLKRYMADAQLIELETEMAKQFVLNPYSEWMKRMTITLAEMGVVAYKGKVPRGELRDQCDASQENRRTYLIHRMAFVRAFFSLNQIKEVQLYRGMTTEGEWRDFHDKSLTSWTFNPKVALSFCDLDKQNVYKNGYILKRMIPVEALFMTYLETEEMNQQYLESEAVLFFNREKGIY